MNKVETLLNHLAYAFGGHSQYNRTDVGHAIAGQINNNGWTDRPEEYAAEAASLLAERWGGQGPSEEEDKENILKGINEVLSKYSRVGRHPGY